MAEQHEIGVERPSEFRNSVERWNAELNAAERVTEQWRKDVQRISDRYSLEEDRKEMSAIFGSSMSGSFNILASNVETMLPAIYGKEPIPVIVRRHRDKDPIGRLASEMWQRALRTDMDRSDLNDTFNRVTLDLLLGARGVSWIRFEPTFYPEEVEGEEEPIDTLVDAMSPIDYVKWSDFLHAPRNTWAEVQKDGWVARRVSMTRDQGVQRFGEVFRKVPLKDKSPGMTEKEMDDDTKREVIGRASVWEIWDAMSGKVIWLNRHYLDSVLDEQEDPLGLDNFFPCPKPAYGPMGNSKLVPVPEYLQYEDLAMELDRQTGRIAALTKALRVTGVYDASMESIGRMLTDEGTEPDRLIPVTEFSSMSGRTIDQVVMFMPLKSIVEALMSLYEAREKTKQVIYEVSGMSDIMRGQVDPREKLGQSRLKGQFASQRLQKKVQVMEHFGRDALAIKAEIMAEHYDPQMLRQMSGFDMMPEVEAARAQQMQEYQEQVQQYEAQMQQMFQEAEQNGMMPPQMPPPPEQPPDIGEQMFQQAIELLRSEKMRGFRLDVETNSTLMIDDDEEKQRRTEFIEATGTFLERALPIGEAVPPLQPLLLDMLQFVVRGFRGGKSLEGSFEQAIEALRAPPEPAPEEQGPSPEQQAAEMEMQMSQAKAETEMQVMQAKAQTDMETMGAQKELKMMELNIKRAEIQAKMQADQMKTETEAALTAAEIETKMSELDIEREKLQMELEGQRQKALIDITTQQATPAPAPQVTPGDVMG